MTNILVVAAHSDDEALGCGGTIAKHAKDGDTVRCVFMTNGVAARGDHTEDNIQERQAAAENAKGVLGIKENIYLNFPDNRMDSVALLDIVQELEAVIEEHKPAIIYTHYTHDLNIDHRLTYQAVITACRPQQGHPVREIYSFEVPSSTEWAAGQAFNPDMFIDISESFDTKMKALEAYAEEMRPAPHPRSMDGVTALASWRGHSVGCTYAEAFETVRVLK